MQVISIEEGPGKSLRDSKQITVTLTLDAEAKTFP